jgi:hypothetical protein
MSNSSTNDKKDPYLRTKNWLDPSWHFWENEGYTEKSKRYFRGWLRKLINESKSLSEITKLK